MNQLGGNIENSNNKRLVSLDILRGIAILAMVFLHNAAFHYGNLNVLLAQDPLPPIIMLFGFLIMWAGIFGVISGLANAFITVNMVAQKESNGKISQNQNSKAEPYEFIWKKGVKGFLQIFLFHWIWTVVTGNSIMTEDQNDPELRTSIVIGLLYYGKVMPIHPEIWFFASSLWMIAINVLVVNLTLYILYKRDHGKNANNYWKYLLILASIVLIITPLLRALLFTPMMDLIYSSSWKMILALPMALLINDPNPMFPFVAYGYFGAAIGLLVAQNQGLKKIRKITYSFGLTWSFVGLIGVIFSGGFVVAGRANIWGQDAFYFASLGYLLMGIFGIFIILLLKMFDFQPEEMKRVKSQRLELIIRPGRLSLTIFIWEGIIAMCFRIILDLLWPRWNYNVVNAVIFGLFNVVFWILALNYWAKFNYKGSLEWILHRSQRSKKEN